MPQHTDSPAPHASGWVELTGSVEYSDGTDTIHATIHPGAAAVTVNYRGGEPLVIETAHLDAFIELLQRAKAAL